MIKCSICSYQCDNWYVSNWRLACHIYFSLGRWSLELAQSPSRVALAWHLAGRSTPFGVTKVHYRGLESCNDAADGLLMLPGGRDRQAASAAHRQNHRRALS